MNRVGTFQSFIALFLITLTLLLTGCGEKPVPEGVFLEGRTMGTTYHIKFFESCLGRQWTVCSGATGV